MRPGVQPAYKFFTAVLSNGATIQLRTAVHRLKPYFSTNDPANHNVWESKVTDEMKQDGADKSREPDFSDFYKKFGGGR